MNGQGSIYRSTIAYPTLAPILPSFDKLIEQSQKVLLTISSFFPFDLFPDKIIVDENKVRIINKFFFFTEKIDCILLDNITDVEITTSPFFATLKIRDASYYRYPRIFKVRLLKIHEALEASRLIQGLISAKKAFIDFSNLNLKVLKEDLELLGDTDEI